MGQSPATSAQVLKGTFIHERGYWTLFHKDIFAPYFFDFKAVFTAGTSTNQPGKGGAHSQSTAIQY